MKAKRAIFMALVLFLVVGTISAQAASVNTTAANQPWRVQVFKGGVEGVTNLSTAFVGSFQTPMLSYGRAGMHYIYMAHAATSAVPGNCGPNNAWYCNQWYDSTLVPSSVSPMATMQIMDTHLVQWAYSTTSGKIRGATVEFMNNMSTLTKSGQDLIQLNKFGGVLVGAPSLQTVGGHYRMAATIRSGGDFPQYQLIYMYYIGNYSNTSCMDGGFAYQCDVIDEATGYNSMGVPSLQVGPDGTVGIAYYKFGGGLQDGLKYAYPHPDSFSFPSNCGPGDPKTWRCISIFAGTATGTLSDVVKLAFGQTPYNRGIVFTYDDELIEVTLMHADYVGAGGNCGWDGGILAAYAWRCSDVSILGTFYNPYYKPSYSIDIDPQGYPVIAYDGGSSEFTPFNLYVGYPKARVGIADPGWIEQEIDGAPTTLVSTGALAALSLDNAGRGFVAYQQEEDYVLPDLKITLQQYQYFLPSIVR